MKTKLIQNKSAGQKNLLQQFSFNVAAGKVRLETLEGREHTVTPMVMLTEGVHEGSNGPLFYPSEELGKIPQVWNHKPVVVYHPQHNGLGISACDPDVINNRKCGIIMNTVFKDGKLKAEAWLERDRAEKVDNRIMPAVDNNEMMELSTGLFIDVEPTEGEWNGEAYVGIARNYRPDHLALLPDQKGACGIADGAGLCRNQAKDFSQQVLVRMAASLGIKDDVTAMPKDNLLYKVARKLGITDNELSFSNMEMAVRTALNKRFNVGESGPWIWIADMFPDSVVYEQDAKLFRLSYTVSNKDEVTLSEEQPTPVRRHVEYRTVEGAYVGNQDQQQENDMNKAALIVAILAANAGWSEKDKPTLEKMTDDQIKSIHNGLPKKETPAPGQPAEQAEQTQNNQPAPAAQPAAAPAVTAGTTNANQPAKVVTAEEYIRTAPPEIQAVLRNGQSALQAEKAKLIGTITKNAANPYTPEQLNAKDVEELRMLARLASAGIAEEQEAPAPLYYGQAPVGNAGGGASEEVLDLPTFNVEEKEEAKA